MRKEPSSVVQIGTNKSNSNISFTLQRDINDLMVVANYILSVVYEVNRGLLLTS